MIETAGLTVVTPMILELCQTSLETGMDMILQEFGRINFNLDYLLQIWNWDSNYESLSVAT